MSRISFRVPKTPDEPNKSRVRYGAAGPDFVTIPKNLVGLHFGSLGLILAQAPILYMYSMQVLAADDSFFERDHQSLYSFCSRVQ